MLLTISPALLCGQGIKGDTLYRPTYVQLYEQDRKNHLKYDFPQSEQRCSLSREISPQRDKWVYVSLCLFRAFGVRKYMRHTVHTSGLSPEIKKT